MKDTHLIEIFNRMIDDDRMSRVLANFYLKIQK